MNNEIIKLFNDSEKNLKKEFDELDRLCDINSMKVINAFRKNNVS